MLGAGQRARAVDDSLKDGVQLETFGAPAELIQRHSYISHEPSPTGLYSFFSSWRAAMFLHKVTRSSRWVSESQWVFSSMDASTVTWTDASAVSVACTATLTMSIAGAH